VLIPFVTSEGEVRELRRILAEEAQSLRSEGKPCRADLPVGIMIETPAAALTADRLAGVSDFFSLGTNDLIQYALAVDRGNSAVSYLYDPLNLGVLRMIRSVVEAARRSGLGVSVCGEMAADPAMATLLVGLGLRELSMPPRAIGAVRDAIRTADSRDAATVAAQALGEER
jgi:phosphotransferase system enzyme I (PtsI)